jgi:IS5 family transposase
MLLTSKGGSDEAAEVEEMSHRQLEQLSLADGLVKRRPGQNEALKRLATSISWKSLDLMLSPIYSAAEGRPAYPPLVMFKCLLLQQWYALSDPQLEEALADRLSFRRFAGLPLDQEVPDHSTVSRFRAQLVERGLGQQLFDEVSRQLEGLGLLVKQGTLIDASLVEASVRPPRDAHSVPGEKSPLDPDADWTKRDGKSFYGYKVHVGMDQGSELIRTAALTSARVSDTALADELISGDERAVYADKSYQDLARSARLAKQGIADGIMRKLMPHSRIPHEELARRNRYLAGIRFAVERKFAVMKERYHYRRVRYRGLAKNRLQVMLMCIAINLKRADRLLAV